MDSKFMEIALEEARLAGVAGDVPVGACVAVGDRLIARGRNRREERGDPLAHAEVEALRAAAEALGGWNLSEATLYVTLEPCQMCAGALVQSRIDEVVIACMNPKAGCAGSVINILEMEGFNHKVKVERGVLEEECSQMLSDFFKSLREKKKALKMLKKSEAEKNVEN